MMIEQLNNLISSSLQVIVSTAIYRRTHGCEDTDLTIDICLDFIFMNVIQPHCKVTAYYPAC